TLITNAEYQLFIDESQAQGSSVHPDHWASNVFPMGSGLHSILGVRHADAKAFCEWLTHRSKDNWNYRLPEMNEVDDSMLQLMEQVEDTPGIGWWLRHAQVQTIKSKSVDLVRIKAAITRRWNIDDEHLVICMSESTTAFSHALTLVRTLA